MDSLGRLWDTLIIFCADHGDFLGDHWLGEKELFYDTVQRVPFIVVDPRPEADARAAARTTALSNAWTWYPPCWTHWACRFRVTASRARACCPLHGQQPAWRQAVYSELDYSFPRGTRASADRSPQQSRALLAAHGAVALLSTGWICPNSSVTCRPTPSSSATSAASPRRKACGARCASKLLDFLARRKHRTTVSDEFIEQRTNQHKQAGVFYGQW